MFKKDDYIVQLYIRIGDDMQFPTNYIYKQREDKEYLLPYIDGRGGTHNGLSAIYYNEPKTWRSATQQEIEKYKELGKPFNVNAVNYEPKYEIY